MNKQIEIDFDKEECTFFGHVVGFDVAKSELIVMDGPSHPSDDGSLGDTNLTVKVKTNVPEGVNHMQLMGQCMLELKGSNCFVVCNGINYKAIHIYVEYDEGKLLINFYGSRKSGFKNGLNQVEK